MNPQEFQIKNKIMKKAFIIGMLFLLIFSCKKNDASYSNPNNGNFTDALTEQELQNIEDTGVDSIAHFADAIFDNGTSINEWITKYDSAYKYAYGRASETSSFQNTYLFIARMTRAGTDLVNDKLHQIATQPNGLAYVYGSKSITNITAEQTAVCKSPFYGVDCSGMIYIMANAAGVPLPVGSTNDYANTAVWNKAFSNSPVLNELEMANLGQYPIEDIIPGDIIVAPGSHIGFVYHNKPSLSLGVLNSLGSPKATCTKNSDAKHGPIISSSVSKWATDIFKSKYQVLRVFQKSLATVTTSILIKVTHTYAEVSGKVSGLTANSVTTRGFCWSTHPSPTLTDSVVIAGAGSGSFSGRLTNLLVYPAYYARAFATNSSGTAYGNEISFTPKRDSTFHDQRDGKNYSFRHIGNQVWMTENFNFNVKPINDTPVSVFYAENEVYGPPYGRLYTWTAAKIATPEGWHLPSGKEWAELYEYLMAVTRTDAYSVDEILKDTILWDPSIPKGNNISGFSARPAGSRYDLKNNLGQFEGLSFLTFWWTADDNVDVAGYFGINNLYILGGSNQNKNVFQSVRYIRNN